MTMIHVLELRVVPPHTLWVRLSDGSTGSVDLTHDLSGEVFWPLRDPAYFALAALDEDAYTVCWPNGADLAPEFLRDRLVAGSPGRVAEGPVR